MRHKFYYREVDANHERLEFTVHHYAEAQVRYTPAVGIHESAALTLVNAFNRGMPGKYWLGEGQ